MLSRALPLAAAAAVLSMSLAACGSDDQSSSGQATDDQSSSVSSSASPSPAGGATTCSYPADSAGTVAKKVDRPPSTPDVSGTVKTTVTTNVGDLRLSLDADKAPCTVNSFVSLAKQGYYDDTPCHRLGATPGFEMLQCGDPTGTGQGGPGYTVVHEYDGSETYPAGTVALARAQDPDSGGSQFFLVYGATQLPPEYTVFGTLDAASIKVLKKVGAAGTDNSEATGVGAPKKKVTLEKVTVG